MAPRPTLLSRLLEVSPPWYLRADLLFICAIWYGLLLSPWLIHAKVDQRGISLWLDRTASGEWQSSNVPSPTGRLRAELVYRLDTGLGWRCCTLLGFSGEGSTWNAERTTLTVLTREEMLSLWLAMVPSDGEAVTSLPDEESSGFQAAVVRAYREGRPSLWHQRWRYPLLVVLAVIPAPVIVVSIVLGMAREFRRAMFRRRIALIDDGLCPTCRYPLQGHEPAQPCPECGAVPRAVRQTCLAELGLAAPATSPPEPDYDHP